MIDEDLLPWITLALGLGVGAVVAWVLLGMPQASTISNTESWELVEDDKGNLKNIIVHRKVKKNGAE